MADTLDIVLVVAGVAKAIEQMETLGRAFSDVQFAAGGTAQATARAASLGTGIGLSTGQTGGLAASIRDAIAAGGMARGAASQLGVGGVLPRGFGGPSDVEIFAQVADSIRNITSEQEAYNLALRLGAPELLRFRLLGEQQIKNIRTLGEEMKRTFSPEAQARIARFQADLEVLQQRAWLMLFRLFDELILQPIYGTNNELHSALSRLSGSMDANTGALNQNTVAINQSRSIYGGGARARGAFPAGLRGELLQKQMQGEAIKLGAFAL
jgi:hypothetical protein